MHEVLERNIFLADKAEKRIIRDSAAVEREIWKLIKELLNDFDVKGGKYVSDETAKRLLSQLNKKLQQLIGETKFYDNISEFLTDFDQVEANLKAAHQDLNGVNVSNKILSSQKDWAIENTTRFLRRAQINVKFIEPVKRALYTRVNYGASVTNTEAYLRQMILGTDSKNGILNRWMGQVARDAINQYEGVINQQIKVSYDMDATRYVGPILLDTRPQCLRWVAMGIIPDSSLEAEIEWARKNGSGLIDETDVSNFCIFRGGYNCVHTGYPTFYEKK